MCTLSPFTSICGLLRRSMVLHGLFMVFYGQISSFLAVIDPNSFVLVVQYYTFTSLTENKQCSAVFHKFLVKTLADEEQQQQKRHG